MKEVEVLLKRIKELENKCESLERKCEFTKERIFRIFDDYGYNAGVSISPTLLNFILKDMTV